MEQFTVFGKLDNFFDFVLSVIQMSQQKLEMYQVDVIFSSPEPKAHLVSL